MEDPKVSMIEIKEALKRIDADLVAFIVKRRHLFNVESYEKWSLLYQTGGPNESTRFRRF